SWLARHLEPILPALWTAVSRPPLRYLRSVRFPAAGRSAQRNESVAGRRNTPAASCAREIDSKEAEERPLSAPCRGATRQRAIPHADWIAARQVYRSACRQWHHAAAQTSGKRPDPRRRGGGSSCRS